MKFTILIVFTILLFINSEKNKTITSGKNSEPKKKITQIIMNRHKPNGTDKWPGKINADN